LNIPTFESQSLLCDFAPVRELLFDAVQDRDRILSFGGRPGRSQANGVLSPEIIQLPTAKPDGPRILLVETSATAEFEYVRKFYLSSGFHEEARIRDFYSAGIDKVVYLKQL
jgi:hypothetical protein